MTKEMAEFLGFAYSLEKILLFRAVPVLEKTTLLNVVHLSSLRMKGY